MRKIILCLLSIFASAASFAQTGKGEYVGGDISLLPSYEASNTEYLDAEGNKIPDLITWLSDKCGWNCFRVRLFVNPQQRHSDGSWDPAVCQDIEYVKNLGKRIKDAGCKFMLDFHYSDTWVDAGHIQAPEECRNMDIDEKAEWIYSYTKTSLESLKAFGATPDFVQVGNEIMYGFMGIKVAPYEQANTDWTGFLKVLKQGCKAVRDACPAAQIIIHTDRPTNSDYINYWYGKLDDADIEYDIIGLSYYPFWHGWLTKAQKPGKNNSLEASLEQLAIDFPTKKVQIVECAYPIQWWPSSGINYDTRSKWPVAEGKCQGQYDFVKDLVAELAKHSNVNGLSYWCPEEAGNGDAANWNTNQGVVISNWMNRGLWWPSSNNGHWPLTSNGVMTVSLLRDFLKPEAAGINKVYHSNDDNLYNIYGQRIDRDYKGIVIQNGKKVIGVFY